MSDVVPYKAPKRPGPKVRDYESPVVGVVHTPFMPTHVSLRSGRTGAGSCLGCVDAPCIQKNTGELELTGTLSSFPGDPSVAVCPSEAIELDANTGFASVVGERCIGCGLCVIRCPYGALNLTKSGKAHASTTDKDGLTTTKIRDHVHPHPLRTGKIGTLSDQLLASLASALPRLSDQDRSLFVRNLLHETGMRARIRRRGDMNVRMDAVGFTRSGRPFVAEIELVGAEIESPRALMEDVAILHARYGFDVQSIDAVSIILAFPNVRSEYYQVIRDIDAVLGVRCRTLTIGALLAVVWAGKTIDGFGGTAFSVEEGGIDLAKSLDIPGLAEPYQGAFRPAK